ncbi:hypothetical protein DKG77_00265 [Flagellimonas aquimarina]|uniref:Uncharacterized protein n=1 Tax=Flagellimonas aquimarina TaxID=2201895 RepID=A0A316L0E5_9FLAO|nr:hypothetical protein DKG77_00265 [Allomuricauda koreensis]
MFRGLFVCIFWVCFCLNYGFAQKTQAELYYKNGRVQKGFAKIVMEVESWSKIFFETGYVQFKETKKSKPILIRLKRLKKVRILEKGKVVTYDFLKVYGEGEAFRAMRLLEKGKVSLYEYKSKGTSNGVPLNSNSLSPMPAPPGQSTYICVVREGEEMATKLNRNPAFSNNFNDAAMYYFRDCPELVEKFKTRKYKKANIKEAVIYYNETCEKSK